MADTPEDDWFPQAEVALSADDAHGPSEDEWLVADEAPQRSSSFDAGSLLNPRVLVPVAIAIVFILGLLAAFGVFDSSEAPATVPENTAAISTATTQATTTTKAKTPTQGKLVAPTTTLKPGDSGAQVKTLQRELVKLGLATGVVDGIYGTGTSNAVSAFQRAQHLAVDGIVGPATLQALKNAKAK
jgi:hypothetical protein